MADCARYALHTKMAKEKKLDGNIISRRFSTMLPLDVLIEFTRFAKKNTSTGLGKFDYGVALRFLLERSNTEDRIKELEDQIIILEMKIREPVILKEKGPLTFGSNEREVEDE